jgi:chaperone modulatory protein CbpM
MRTLAEVTLLLGRVESIEIHAWIERGWVAPQGRRGGEPLFSELDVARLGLICDLRHDLAVEDETMPLVLSLLDQVYTLRRQLGALTDAVQRQPPEVRRAILDRLRERRGPRHE